MTIRDAALVVGLLLISGAAGCRMGVPIHVWEPPRLASTVGKRVAVSVVAESDELAESIQERLIDGTPRDHGRSTELVDAETLQSDSPIQLVSANDRQVNDVALAPVARRNGFDFMLHGRVRGSSGAAGRGGPTDSGPADSPLALSWRLTELGGDARVLGAPVVIELASAIEQYPDLGLLADPTTALTEAVARETTRLLTPSVTVQRVQLAIPYLTPGSRSVRRGNALALRGDWAAAKDVWMETLERYPAQSAALVNLAHAAVAEQDFTSARALARHAVLRHPSRLAGETLVWVEQTQRRYHQSFQLPDPPEGWVVTRQAP